MGYKDIERAHPNRRSRVMAIINQKGGVGKSTTAVDLSAALAQEGQKVLVIDFDPQGNATSGFGIDKDELDRDIYDVVMTGQPMADIICETPQEGCFAAPATIDLAGAEIELVEMEHRERALRDALSPVRDDFDYVFVDCPPSLGVLTVDALAAADSLLIPIQCEFYALEGLAKLLESMRRVKSNMNPSLEIFGVLMTMYDGRTTLSKQVVEEVRNFFGDKTFQTMIPRNVKVSEAPSHGLPINKYARLSKGALAYGRLAKEVIARG